MGADPQAPASEAEAPPKRRSPIDVIRDAPKLAAAIGGIAGAILTVIALYTTVFGGGEKPTPDPRKNQSAELTVLQRDPNVRQGAYLAAEGRQADLGALSTSGRRELGNVFTLRFVLEGVQGLALPLRWTMFDAESRTALGQRPFKNRLVATLRPSTAVSEGERGVVRIWVPLPPRTGSYFVRFDLGDGEGGLLETADSAPFPVVSRR